MPLNIKNERVSKLAVQLAAETGTSITEAVGQALDARLVQLHRRKQRLGLAERLLEIGRQCASEAPTDWLERDFDVELYDELGLPR